ncbi:hypothetical protein PF010_g32299, partial [Phytophthora fragariae]
MATFERDIRLSHKTTSLTAPQVEAPLDCNMQQQPMGEFMAHARRGQRIQRQFVQYARPADAHCSAYFDGRDQTGGGVQDQGERKHYRATQEIQEALAVPARHGAPQQHQENGEKQAALAREYGVTRAAICHIKKNHRDEIITRYDLPVNQVQETDRAENVSDQPDEEGAVRELRSSSALLLM